MFRFFIIIILAAIAFYDAKTLEINDKFLSLLFTAVIILTPSDTILANLPAAAGPWVFYLLTAVICSFTGSMPPIGMGDIKLLSVLALCEGTAGIMTVFCSAGLISGVYSAVLLIMKKTEKGSEIPFAPFIAAAYAAVCLFHIYPNLSNLYFFYKN